MDDKQNKSEDQVPSFATLPRKKKLSGNATSGTAQSAPQVTWMKEVAQKGVFLVILRDTTHLNNGTMTRLCALANTYYSSYYKTTLIMLRITNDYVLLSRLSAAISLSTYLILILHV